MSRKIKKKEEPQTSNQGKIILIIAGVFLAVIAVVLVIMAIVQNTGKKDSTPSSQSSITHTSETTSKVSTISEDASVSGTDYLDSVVIDTTKTYYADIQIRNYGKIIVQLDYNAAPITTKNFIYLTESGFYNGLTFHRIMEGFMMQGGDPRGNGTGGSEHNIYGEFSANGYNNPLSHTRGAISMARNSFDMNSASSQFFIVQSDNHISSLDGNYAAFGYVTQGLDIVDAVCRDAKPTDTNGTIPADQQPVIESITIRTTDLQASKTA